MRATNMLAVPDPAAISLDKRWALLMTVCSSKGPFLLTAHEKDNLPTCFTVKCSVQIRPSLENPHHHQTA